MSKNMFTEMDKIPFGKVPNTKAKPNLSECIKEWEERGYRVVQENHRIFLSKEIIINELNDVEALHTKTIKIYKKYGSVFTNLPLDPKDIELIHKTLKALEDQDE